MKQREKILRILTNNQELTQSQIALQVYEDSSHNTAIYSALQKMVNEGLLNKNGSPARYSLINLNSAQTNNVQANVHNNSFKKTAKTDLSFEECDVYSKKWAISNLIYNATKDTSFPLVPGIDFYVVHQEFNHNPAKLPNGKMAVYTFHTSEECLKVGQVSARSGDRYQRQHYKLYRNRANSSTLAKSILEDQEFSSLNLDDDSVGEWIKENCERFDVLINVPTDNQGPDMRKEKIILNMIEGLLQMYFNPRYEG